jgi:hypothetical protein
MVRGRGLKSLPKVLDVFVGDELFQGCVHGTILRRARLRWAFCRPRSELSPDLDQVKEAAANSRERVLGYRRAGALSFSQPAFLSYLIRAVESVSGT